VETHKQPGCWLRSSHAFKECVTAHWSIVILRGKYNGAKRSAEDANVHRKVYVVEERSSCGEVELESSVERGEVRMLE
jgi:hypothetical protein